MKRNLTVKSIVVSVALSALLTGCGSTGADEGSDTSNVQSSISGKAIDGYLQNAVVCLDLSNDGYCQASSEPLTTTLADGSFRLEITPEHRENENFDEAMLLIFGGVDQDTGKDFMGKLMAPNDGSAMLNVSPITTIVAKNVQKALKAERKLTKEQIKEHIKQARKKVADALEIEEDEVGLDPVERKIAGDDKLIRKALQIQKSIEAQLIAAKISDKDFKEKIEDMYEALADGLDDMEDGEIGLDKIFEKAAGKDKFKEVLRGQKPEDMLAIVDKISQNIEDAFEDAEIDDDLEKIAAISRDDMEKIREATEGGDLSTVIEGIVYLPTNDWLRKYIEQDLLEIGIKPTPALVNKLKAVYKNDIRAGVLLNKAEKLKESADEELRNIYKRILFLKEKSQKEQEAEDAKYETEVKVNLKELLSGKTLYVVDMDDERDSSGKYTFSFEIEELKFNDDVTSVIDEDDEVTALKIDGNNIYAYEEDEDDEDVLTFKSQTEDYYEFYAEHGEPVRFFKDLSTAEAFATEMKEKFEEIRDYFPDYRGNDERETSSEDAYEGGESSQSDTPVEDEKRENDSEEESEDEGEDEGSEMENPLDSVRG